MATPISTIPVATDKRLMLLLDDFLASKDAIIMRFSKSVSARIWCVTPKNMQLQLQG